MCNNHPIASFPYLPPSAAEPVRVGYSIILHADGNGGDCFPLSDPRCYAQMHQPFFFSWNTVNVTVRGAGHMVPRYRSEEALTLIDAFFAGSPLPGYSKGGSGHVSPATCRVTTDSAAVQSKSSSGHDSWMLSSTGLYHRVNGTYCGPHARTLAADAWAYTGDVTEAACLAACEKVHCTCFDTK